MRRIAYALPWIGALLCAAATVSCMAAPDQPPDNDGSLKATSPRKPEPILNAPTGQPATGEVPAAAVEKLRAELAAQAGVDVKAVKVVAAESVQWPNGALGCPEPGRMYTQAIVPGYRVVLEAGGKSYHYHSSEKGSFSLCRNPTPSPVGAKSSR